MTKPLSKTILKGVFDLKLFYKLTFGIMFGDDFMNIPKIKQ